MRTAESKPAPAATKAPSSFFSREGGQAFSGPASQEFSGPGFFGSAAPEGPFFTPRRGADQSNAPSNSTTPPIQAKCAACEKEEKLQKKEEVDEKDALKDKVQRKPIFDSNAEPPEDDRPSVQGKCTECEKEKKEPLRPPPSFIVIGRVIPVVSQANAPQVQLRANLALAPKDLSCILMDIHGTPGALDVFFTHDGASLDATALADIENFVGLWVGRGLSDDLTVSGFASKEGSQARNWRLSCQRAESVQAELTNIGVPADKISTFAHGETEDFDATRLEPNRRATITTTAGTGPVITPVLTPSDNFAGRSLARFGIRENMTISYTALPAIAAAEHFGVQWTLVTGTGTLLSLPSFTHPPIPGAYQAGNTPATEQLALTVVTGPAATTRLVLASIPLIAPAPSHMEQLSGTGLCHLNGRASVTYRGNIFMRPTDVSFSNIQWKEGTATMIATGSLKSCNGEIHPPTPSPISIGPGNSTTGCQLNGSDLVGICERVTPDTGFLGMGTPDWTGLMVWPIEWQYVAPGLAPVTYMIANQIGIVDSAGTAKVFKADAGPFTTSLGDPNSCVAAVGGFAGYCGCQR